MALRINHRQEQPTHDFVIGNRIVRADGMLGIVLDIGSGNVLKVKWDCDSEHDYAMAKDVKHGNP